jgi:hypothetical protein
MGLGQEYLGRFASVDLLSCTNTAGCPYFGGRARLPETDYLNIYSTPGFTLRHVNMHLDCFTQMDQPI